MKNQKKTYGQIIVHTNIEEEILQIEEFLQLQYTDRTVSITKLENGNYCLAVENPYSSGRNPQTTFHLTEESLKGIITVVMLYFKAKNIDIMTKHDFYCEFSDNITEEMTPSLTKYFKIKN